MSKLNNIQFKKATVAVLTALMLIAIAAPLLSVAAAAGSATASLSPVEGPNGTLVKVTGSGFAADQDFHDFDISVDGHDVGVNSISNETYIKADYRLKTDSNGVLTGYFIIYNLSPGRHTVMISGEGRSVTAGTFRITTPTVTLTPSSGPAGSPVIVTASGFPTTNGKMETASFGNNITAATFSGEDITVPTVAGTKYTDTETTLSSIVIAKDILGNYVGTYTGTVTLGAYSEDDKFTLTDWWGNTGTTTLSFTESTVTLSPNQGTVGTLVTATVTGLAPSAHIEAILIGNDNEHREAIALETATPATTEQGTAVFVFQIPAGDEDSKSGTAGAQTVTVIDSMGNAAEATFTVKPKVTIEMGITNEANGVSSTTSYVPRSTVANMKIIASGFLPNTAISITALNGATPFEWTTPNATWAREIGTYDNGYLYTNDNGQLVVSSTNDTINDFPTAKGTLPIRFSDGTNYVTENINVVASADILVVTPSGAAGQTGLMVKYFGTTPTALNLGATEMDTSVFDPAQDWPVVTTATFDVPVTTAGVKTISALPAATFGTSSFTVLTPTLTVVTPASSAVGTTVTVVGTGFANTDLIASLQGSSIDVSTASIVNGTLIATFDVPNFLPDTYVLSVSDSVADLPLNTATKEFTVAPAEVSITPESGKLTARATIAIEGSGFQAGEGITVKFDSQTIWYTTQASQPRGITGLIKTNANGDILLLSGIPLPEKATAGTHTITVTSTSGAYATDTFVVRPQLTELAAVRPGAQVTVTGAGFAPNSAQTLLINGTQTTWIVTHTDGPATAVPSGTSIVTQPNGDLYATSTVGFVVPSTQASGAINVTVTDGSSNSASTILTILDTPVITVGTTNIVAGVDEDMGVSINGTGFSPRLAAPVSAKLFEGSTLKAIVDLNATAIDVTSAGKISGLLFAVPAGTPEGEYTLQLTLGSTSSTPVETATTTITVMGAPTVDVPETVAAASNVTITVTGLTEITEAKFGDVDLLADEDFGTTEITNSGADAYTLTTWFIAPSELFAGSYLLTLKDGNTQLSAQASVTITPTIVVDPTSDAKGELVAIYGAGFASESKVTATFNGQTISLVDLASEDYHYDHTCVHGQIETYFIVPLTALQTNTVTLTDAVGNSASATFNVTSPTITLSTTEGPVGTTVQIIGSDFAGNSFITIQIGGTVVTPTTANLKSNENGQFITYATIPNGLSGNVTVSATDGNNNVATQVFTIGGSPGNAQISQTTMTSTAQTTTTSGTATTSFTAGSTVKASFILQSQSGSRDVVVAVTFQQGAKVYNMASFQTTMTALPSTVSFSNLIPAGATGTWTATLQVFAIDGVTPLGVTTLTFTVA